MLGSALASFRPEGRGFIFLFIPGAEGSEGGLSPEGHLPLSAIPVLEARGTVSKLVRVSGYINPKLTTVWW